MKLQKSFNKVLEMMDKGNYYIDNIDSDIDFSTLDKFDNDNENNNNLTIHIRINMNKMIL